MTMRVARRYLSRQAQCLYATRSRRSGRPLLFQPLESRQLLAAIGDWAVLDLRSYFVDDGVDFHDLSGVVFHDNQLAVAANVESPGQNAEARLVLVDYDIDAHTAVGQR